MSVRTYFGAGVWANDNGRSIDPKRLTTIEDEDHPLHGRRDPTRYDVRNEDFAAFVNRVEVEGPPPAPILVRRAGLLDRNSAQYKYLQKRYPDEVKAHPEQPRLEVVAGNRRVHALRIAEERWIEQKIEKFVGSRLLAVIKALSDDEAEEAFVAENANRQKTSFYEDQLAVRSMIDRNMSWPEIARRLNQPEKEIRRIHNTLLECALPVVAAFSLGQITLSKAQRIADLGASSADQLRLLEEGDCDNSGGGSEDAVKLTPKSRKKPTRKIEASVIPIVTLQKVCSGNGQLTSAEIAEILQFLKLLDQSPRKRGRKTQAERLEAAQNASAEDDESDAEDENEDTDSDTDDIVAPDDTDDNDTDEATDIGARAIQSPFENKRASTTFFG